MKYNYSLAQLNINNMKTLIKSICKSTKETTNTIQKSVKLIKKKMNNNYL